MKVCINDSIYSMDEAMFNNVVETVLDKNSSRYFIYCLGQSDIRMLLNEIPVSLIELLMFVSNYLDKGLDVYYIKEGERCVEYSTKECDLPLLRV